MTLSLSNPQIITTTTSPYTTRSLSIILLVYNKEAVISSTIFRVMEVTTPWIQDFEIIVVNDGSKDHTGEIVARLAANNHHIRLINHPVNKGCGAALVSGFKKASKQFVFYMDSDGQFDINELHKFFPLVGEYDGVFGYRINRQDTWLRKLNAWGWNRIVRFVFGVRLRDVDCAFKLFNAEFFRTNVLEAQGALLLTEIVYKFARAGYTYTEVGVHHLPRHGGKGTGAKLSVILHAFAELLYYANKWSHEENLVS